MTVKIDKIPAIIQARMTSKRFPGKIMSLIEVYFIFEYPILLLSYTVKKRDYNPFELFMLDKECIVSIW